MQRVAPPNEGDERELLLGWLAFHRDALADKCKGLTDAQLIKASSSPSTLSLLGLVRHMSEMERAYIHAPLTGGAVLLRYCSAEQPEGDFDGLRVDQVDPSLEAWREDVRRSEELVANAELGEPVPGTGRSLRWHLFKLLTEYTRHSGHADLLRERIDGATGE